MKKNFKYDRLAEDIKKKINEIIDTEIDELDFVTVTDVELTKDLGDAKVYITALDSSSKEYALETLSKREKMIRKLLAEGVQMRRVPNLIFKYDSTLDNYNRIENILKNEKNDK